MFKEGDIVIHKDMFGAWEGYDKYTIKNVWNSDIPNWKVQYLIECNKTSYNGSKMTFWVDKDKIRLDTKYYREQKLESILN